MNRVLTSAVYVLLFRTAIPGQTVTLNFNSLPSAQGWNLLSTCPAPETSLFSVTGTSLHMNTIGCGNNGSYYTLNNVASGKPFALTVRARVTADEWFPSNVPPGVTQGHTGLGFGVDVAGYEFYIGIGPGFVESGNLCCVVLSTIIDTTQFHTYVLSGNPGDGSFTLSVDGSQIGSGYAGSNVPLSANDIFVGDGTGAANAEGDYTQYTYHEVGSYNICLLYDPTKAVHSGATTPIKLQLCSDSGNNLSSPGITVHAVSVTQTSTSISGPVQDSGNANPDNDFRYDSKLGTTGGYIFNLSTVGRTTGTYNLNFTVTGDSAVYAAPFQVK